MKILKKQHREDACLNFYLGVFLEWISFLGTRAYYIVSLTGTWFRSQDIFASTLGRRGVLQAAGSNLRRAGIRPPGAEAAVLKSYLRYESRFALESIWIRKRSVRQILGAFDAGDVKRLESMLKQNRFIIAIPHMSALYAFVALVQVLGHKAPFVVKNPLAAKIAEPAPFQKGLMKLFHEWRNWGQFVFIQDGNVFQRCLDLVRKGSSLIIAPDTPSGSGRNTAVEFLGRKTAVARGAAAIAHGADINVLAVCPWAKSCRRPYQLEMKVIESKDEPACMTEIFSFFQTVIRQYPSCWNGWLYWDQMDHKEA